MKNNLQFGFSEVVIKRLLCGSRSTTTSLGLISIFLPLIESQIMDTLPKCHPHAHQVSEA